jgi:hypothetical protein
VNARLLAAVQAGAAEGRIATDTHAGRGRGKKRREKSTGWLAECRGLFCKVFYARACIDIDMDVPISHTVQRIKAVRHICYRAR